MIDSSTSKAKPFDQVRYFLRTKHYSKRTEKAYVGCIQGVWINMSAI